MKARAFVRMIYLQMPKKEGLLNEIWKRRQDNEVSFDLLESGKVVCKRISQAEEVSALVVSEVQAECLHAYQR